jgi:hypothetical protein
MPFSFRKLTKLQLIALCIVVVSALTALGVNRKLLIPKTKEVTPKTASANLNTMPAVQKQVTPDVIDVERVSLTERGFEPKEITRVKGRFLLVIDSRTGSSTPVTFGLVEDKGKKLKEVKSHGNQKGLRDFFDLNPGKYLVTVAENPEWVCAINITVK